MYTQIIGDNMPACLYYVILCIPYMTMLPRAAIYGHYAKLFWAACEYLAWLGTLCAQFQYNHIYDGCALAFPLS